MKRYGHHPYQITLPLEIEAAVKTPTTYRQRKIETRREHSGGPALGMNYGYEYPDDAEGDSHGAETKPNLVPIIYFDFESVYRHLDGDYAEDARAAVLSLAAEAMSAMTEWLQEQFVPRQQNLWVDSSGSGSLPNV